MPLEAARQLPQSQFITQHHKILDNLDKLVVGGDLQCELYQHQVKAVKEVQRDFSNPNPAYGQFKDVSLVVLPTGTGKSGVAVLAAYCCNVARVLVVTPSVTVANQIFTDFQYKEGHLDAPFLERRRVFTPAERYLYMPYGELIKKTAEAMSALETAPLVVVNAQKFGTQSSVNLADVPNEFPLVIIDEAHHYPAKTWKDIVQRFSGSKILFLTATPYHNVGGKPEYILGGKEPCFVLKHDKAVRDHIIRSTKFVEVTGGDSRDGQILKVLECMKRTLIEHDQAHPGYKHQGMILATDINEAHQIAQLWDNQAFTAPKCGAYVSGSSHDIVRKFKAGNLDALVVIFRLTEGFDHKNVSVVGILRNVQLQSRVYFSQFVGRAVRKLDPSDNVTATVISHSVHNQQPNYALFQQEDQFVAEVDPVEPAEVGN